MPASIRSRTALAGVLAVLIAAPPAAAIPPLPVDAPPPDPDVCRAMGFSDVPGREDYYGVPLAMHPSPPPPIAYRQAPAEAVIVTGQARAEEAMSKPPAGVMPPPQASYHYGPYAGTIDRDRYEDVASNPIHRVADDPVSTFSIDVDTASYANVRRYLSEGRTPPRDAVRVEEMINYFDYGYDAPRTTGTPFSATTVVVPSPWSADRQIIHIGLQGYEIPRNQQPPLNLVFLIDTSGSMRGHDKLPLAKQALNVLVNQLRPQDRVSIVAYAGSAGAVLAPTSGRDQIRVRCALGALESGGSTAGGAGLDLAYRLAEQNFDDEAVNRVILLTDGDFNVGVADHEKLEDFVADKRKTGVYLSVYGFGHGNYNDVMMQTLAQAGNGTAAYIDSIDEGRKVFRDDFSSSLFPIADDVKIQVEFNPAVVQEYRLIGYETRMLQREDFNNDRVDAGEVGAGASVTALYEIALVGAAPSADPLRYQPSRNPPEALRPEVAAEFANLKVRYKLPGESRSRLMSRAITHRDVRTARSAPESTRWAMAVAGFGQKLRGDPWVEDGFGWAQVGQLARGAMGRDEHGLRAQFLQLVAVAGGQGPLED